jgi:hypothetical protein
MESFAFRLTNILLQMDGSFAQAPLSSMLWAEALKSRKSVEEMTRVRAPLDIIIVWFRRLTFNMAEFKVGTKYQRLF